MRIRFFILIVFISLLSGCYCKKFYRGYSSVRELKAVKSYTLCYDLDGLNNGKKVLTTIYTGDPYFMRYRFRQLNKDYEDYSHSSQVLIGARVESFLKLGSFPGPLLGIGLDYSFSRFDAAYELSGKESHRILQEHRIQLSLNYVTWIRPRMMGYISLQPGYELSRIQIEKPIFKRNNYLSRGKMNLRAAYGFQFYIRPPLEINLELGYGAGAFARVGLGIWF